MCSIVKNKNISFKGHGEIMWFCSFLWHAFMNRLTVCANKAYHSFVKKAHHSCQWIGKHIIVVYGGSALWDKRKRFISMINLQAISELRSVCFHLQFIFVFCNSFIILLILFIIFWAIPFSYPSLALEYLFRFNMITYGDKDIVLICNHHEVIPYQEASTNFINLQKCSFFKREKDKKCYYTIYNTL